MEEWLQENQQTYITSECARIYVFRGRKDLFRNRVYATKADEKSVTMVAHQSSYSAMPPRFLEGDHKDKAYIWFLCGLPYNPGKTLKSLPGSDFTLVLTTPRQCSRCSGRGFESWVRKTPWRIFRQPTPVFLFGESCGQGNLAGHSPWGRRIGHNLATEHPRSLQSVDKWKAIWFQLGVWDFRPPPLCGSLPGICIDPLMSLAMA